MSKVEKWKSGKVAASAGFTSRCAPRRAEGESHDVVECFYSLFCTQAAHRDEDEILENFLNRILPIKLIDHQYLPSASNKRHASS